MSDFRSSTKTEERSTCLKWGPSDGSLRALVTFQAEIARQLDHARRRSAENVFCLRLVSFYERELLAVSDQIVTRRRQKTRRKRAA